MSQLGTEELLARAWPEGAPETELALLRALPGGRRKIVHARLAAILSVEDGGPVGEAADSLGVDRIAFYRLRRKWQETRSVRAVTPFAGRAPRRIAAGLVPDGGKLALAVVRGSSANASARSMAIELMGRALGLSEPTALRLVREARMALSADHDHLLRTFGSVTLIDVCAVSLAVDLGREHLMTPVVSVVMDRSSRLVLGHAAGLPQEAPLLQRAAVGRACVALGRSAATDAAGRSEVEVEVVLADGAETYADAVRRAVPGPALELSAGGPRRFGQRMISLTGHRLGRLRLRPRSTAASSPCNGSVADLSHPPISTDDAVALIDEAVDDHNRARLGSLASDVADRSADPVLSFFDAMAGGGPVARMATLLDILGRLGCALDPVQA